MKKYLLLLFLFIIYLALISNKQDSTYEVALLDTDDNNYAINIKLEFKDGINSNTLQNILNEYDKEYFVNKIYLNNETVDISCKEISSCISDIFKLKDDYFYNKYILNGFVIKSLDLIAYKNEVLPFLSDSNIKYSIK